MSGGMLNRRPGQAKRAPGPITTGRRVARKPSNGVFEADRARSMGPGFRRDDARTSHPFHRHRNLRAVLDGLIDHAIALGELEQQVELLLRRVGFDLEAQADLGEADRRLLVDPERAAGVDLAFDIDTDAPQEKIDTLLKLTERYCVVFQTINTKPELAVQVNRTA